MPWDFSYPAGLWLLLLVPAVAVASYRALASLGRGRRIGVLLARSTVLLLLTMCLAGIRKVQRSDDLTVVFLMDRSHSVQALEERQDQFIREATKKMPSTDFIGMVDFARRPYIQQKPMRGGYILPPGRLPSIPDTDRTNISSAVRLAMALFPHDTTKRLVIMTDGNDNMGDVQEEIRRAVADGVGVDVLPLQYEHRNEVYFDRFLAPTHAEAGETVTLRMGLVTSQTTGATIRLYANGRSLDLPEENRRVLLQPPGNTFVIKLPMSDEGTQIYEADVQVDHPALDANPLNNTARTFTFRSSTGRVLVVSASPSEDRPLVDALRAEGVLVEQKTPEMLGTFDLVQMMGYATIILSNVPAAAFTDDQQQALALYVGDMGSGLIMTGGNDGFGAGGWIDSPVEEIMPVSFEVKHKRVIPRGALVLIMHSCELPRGNYWAKETVKKSVDTISTQDYIGVLIYSYAPPGESWEIPLQLNSNKSATKARIEGMVVGDMPDFGTTMQMAYQGLTAGRGRDAAQKHVIILSDGDASPPTPQLLNDYVKAKITVSTIAIGWGNHVNPGPMRHLASVTGGNFYEAKDPNKLPTIFSKEAKVVRRPLIMEEPFTPVVADPNSELLTGIDIQPGSIPALGGLVLTTQRPGPNVLTPIVRVTNEGEDPVLAAWQYQLGKSVVYTSGRWPVWGRDWTKWSQFAKFWAQLVRWTARQETPANFECYTKLDGTRARIIVDAIDNEARYLNNLLLDARLIGADNQPLEVRFSQTGPGKYEADFDIDRSGQYLATIQLADGTRSLGTLRAGVSVPFSPEYRDLHPNEPLLRKLVEISGGRQLDGSVAPETVFRHDLPPAMTRQSAWSWLLRWFVLPAFLLDVAARRLASRLALSLVVELLILVVLFFGFEMRYAAWWGWVGALVLAELVGWIFRWPYLSAWRDVTRRGTMMEAAAEGSAVAVRRLRSTRERMRGESQESAVPRSYRSGETESAVEGRWDPTATEPRPGVVPPLKPEEAARPGTGTEPESGQPGRPEDATARLLKAKRRARGEDSTGSADGHPR